MGYKSDIEIAQEAKARPINEIAGALGIPEKYIENYGPYKAKIDYRYYNDALKDRPDAKLVLVTAINPTPAGEGKTTVTIGLADALNRLDKKAMIAMREPSLGPVFGVKGGAAGGGYAQVVPMEDINLHLQATSTPSELPTTCWRLCLTTISTRETPCASIPSALPSEGRWT